MAILDSINRLLGDPNEKELKKLWPIVHAVREKEKDPAIRALTREALPMKTEELKAGIAAGATLDDLLPEAFAVVVRACELIQGETLGIGSQALVWDMVPFDVQLLGGAVLHRGGISEMKTGEGKTLVSTLPVYLNALAGKGVHVVTVNDYLAKRDSAWMGVLFKALGLTVGCVVHGLSTEERRAAYASDITYGTNNEFGFDYLRDNMASSLKNKVQRELYFAIVDEVDSILVDEARTPLIISQPAGESTAKYGKYAVLVRQLQPTTHFTKDEKQRAAVLTDDGIKMMEKLLGIENIYTEKGFEEVHHIEQALRAYAIYQRDVDYVVKDGEVIIVDEFTGRLMPGRRYSHGLHQAIEAKEGVEVQRESKTLATITFQNYFRLYKKLAGMTGTAKTEEEEFESIYKLRTVVIPTHRPMVRIDNPDSIYRTVAAKFTAVAKLAKEKHALGQPVLIGTTSIEKSEVMSALLTEHGVAHSVLNAKQHEKEADIIALAGQKGTVTIATNMAGRGTDIKLGEGVAALGGLCIIGTERHESRRIDNQLRGRSGRQGDKGESHFFVSMEDDLMRLFGGDRLKTMMEKLQVPDDQPLQNAIVSRSIQSAQKRVEGHHFDMRKHVLQYDDVMNRHRDIIYKRRHALLEKLAAHDSGPGSSAEDGTKAGGLRSDIVKALKKEVASIALSHAPTVDVDAWEIEKMSDAFGALHPELQKTLSPEAIRAARDPETLKDLAETSVARIYETKCAMHPSDVVSRAERVVVLRSIDTHWMDHIDTMAHLREQVAFSGYAQRDPLIEYQDRAFRMFQELLQTIDTTIVRTLMGIDFAQFVPQRIIQQADEELSGLQTNEGEIENELRNTGVVPASLEGSSVLQGAQKRHAPAQRMIHAEKVGRNDPCPCGSGKKYKKCHGIDS